MSTRPEPTKDGPQGPRPATPTERGDGDYTGTASGLSSQNLPREAVHGQAETGALPKAKPDDAKLRGVDEGEGKSDPFAPNGEPRPSRFHVPG